MSSTLYKNSTMSNVESASNNWPVVTMLFLLLAIPGLPALAIVMSVLVGLVSDELPLAFVKSLYLSKPWAVLVHGLSGVLFFISAPFQFSSGLRSKRPKLHKYSGYLVFVAGIIMAVSAIWMHHTLTPNDVGPRYVGLVAMSFTMCISFTVAVKHIVQRNIFAHHAWMIRAIAITLAAVTYLFVEITFSLTLGQIESLKPLIINLLYDYGRFIAIVGNLIVAEYLIKRSTKKHR